MHHRSACQAPTNAPACVPSIGRKEIECPPSRDSPPDSGRELESSVGKPPKMVRIPGNGEDVAGAVGPLIDEELFAGDPSGGRGSVTAVGVCGVLQVGLCMEELVLVPSPGAEFWSDSKRRSTVGAASSLLSKAS